jgi:ABC-type polysaccharide/polyol phosphate transport system ATPase subunit
MSAYAVAIDLGIKGMEATIRTKRGERFKRLPRLLSSHQLSPYWVFRQANVSVGPGEGVLVVDDDPVGSTAFMRSICGLLPADEGSVHGDSRSVMASLPKKGIVRGLSVGQTIVMVAGLYGMSDHETDERMDEVIRMAQVRGILGQRIEEAPRHVREQISFSLAMVAPADILAFPGRPLVGGPEFQSRCAGLLAEQRERGRALLIRTSNVGLARMLCDTAIFLDEEGSTTMPMGEAREELERRAREGKRQRQEHRRAKRVDPEDDDMDDTAGY